MELDALLATVSESIKKAWRVERFAVLFTWTEKTWWGAVRRTIVADLGWERARLAIVVREDDATVLATTLVGYPVPREQLPLLSDDELLSIARREWERRGWKEEFVPFRNERGFGIRSRREYIGFTPSICIDDRTGVVLAALPGLRR